METRPIEPVKHKFSDISVAQENGKDDKQEMREETIFQNRPMPSASVVNDKEQQEITVSQPKEAEASQSVSKPQYNYQTIVVFADRMQDSFLQDKQVNVSSYNRNNRFRTFRMAKGDKKGWSFKVPEYMVRKGKPVGKDKNIDTLVLRFPPYWKLHFYDANKNVAIRECPIQTAAKMIQNDMSPYRSLTASRPLSQSVDRQDGIGRV